jgi:hypothetical protein
MCVNHFFFINKIVLSEVNNYKYVHEHMYCFARQRYMFEL